MLKYDKYDKFDLAKKPRVVLDNKLKIKDVDEWQAMEFALSRKRIEELKQNPDLIKRTFDGEHLRAIHKYVFQDCYKWAGELRDNGGKYPLEPAQAGQPIQDRYYEGAYTTDIYLPMFLVDVKGSVQKWTKADGKYTKDEMLDLCANTFYAINEHHFFREGNVRVGNEFIRELAEENGYHLDLDEIEQTKLADVAFITISNKCYKEVVHDGEVRLEGEECALTKKAGVQMLKDLYSHILTKRGQAKAPSPQLQALRAAVKKQPKFYGASNQASMENVEE